MLARITGRPVRWSQDRRRGVDRVGIHARAAGPRRRASATTTTAACSPTGPTIDRRRRQPRPLLLGHRAVAGDGRARCPAATTCRRSRVRPVAASPPRPSPRRRLPRVRPAAGAPHHRTGARPHRGRRSASTRSRCGAATCIPDDARGRGHRARRAASTRRARPAGRRSCVDAFDMRRLADAAGRGPRRGPPRRASACRRSCRARRRRSTASPGGSVRSRRRRASVLPDGSVTVTVGTKSQGQAHETVVGPGRGGRARHRRLDA